MTYLSVEPLPGLRQGLFARGSIEMQRKSALVVPLSALRLEQALPYVLAVQDGKVVQRRVKLGSRGDVTIAGQSENAVEILEGLREGETVLRGSVGTIKPGVAVRLAAAASAASR